MTDTQRAQARETNPPCTGCGGPHAFDTSVPSPLWNRVVRGAGLPDYLCLTCIARAFAKAGVGFTAELYGDGFHGLPIELHVDTQTARSAVLLTDENNRLRVALQQALRYLKQFASQGYERSKAFRDLAAVAEAAYSAPADVAEATAALREENARLLEGHDKAQRLAALAVKARDQYDEERRESYQRMCGWKGRAEIAESQVAALTTERDTLREALEGVIATARPAFHGTPFRDALGAARAALKEPR